MKTTDDPEESRRALTRLLSVRADEFWRHHFDFDQPTARPIAALGLSRMNELLINTVIPVALLYARIFKDGQVREHTLRCYDTFPPMEDNTLTRLMHSQLLHSRPPFDAASEQQAVIQLYKYYCTENRCNDCEVGKIVFTHD